MENTLLTCEGLHEGGDDVTLLTGPPLGPEGELLSRANAGGYRVIVLPDLRRDIHPLRDLRAQRAIRRTLRTLQPDVMHSHASKAGILARRAAWRLGSMKIVHTIHGLPFHPYQPRWKNALYIALERKAARQSHALISVADAMTRQALAAGVGQPEQFTTIYSGMDVERFIRRPPQADAFRASLHLPPEAVLVTQVSRLAELKGHDSILDAAGKLTNPNVHFCFVGDGRLRTAIEADIRRRGMEERFHLTGLLPPEQIPAVMHATDILVHCSWREGLARTLPQALLAGRPVVCFDVDGAREVVRPDTGVLLRPGDTDGLASAIDTLAADLTLRDRLGRAGRELCRQRFDWREMVRQIRVVYASLLDPPHPGHESA